MVYMSCHLYESDSSPCDINHQKDYTAWTSYDKNNLLLFIDILFLDKSLMIFQLSLVTYKIGLQRKIIKRNLINPFDD
jgi:hypothetical protein